ncbi:MAG TPA: PhzF family phenazine biosynthesis protein [Rhizomicrobium sp.]
MPDVSRSLELRLIDVFSRERLLGNPAAIVLGGQDLSNGDMQRIASFLNLSETVFLLPASNQAADCKTRTFTVRREIPFAGHAALAAAHAHAERHGNSERIIQECDAGLLTVCRRAVAAHSLYWLDLPRPQSRATHVSAAEVGSAIGLAPSRFAIGGFPVARTGPAWLLAELDDEADLSLITPDAGKITDLAQSVGAVGLTAFARSSGGIDFRLRTFAPAAGIPEDPVCGSCAGAIVAHLVLNGTAPRTFHLRQGRELGRDGEIAIEVERGRSGLELRLGGRCHTVCIGELCL